MISATRVRASGITPKPKLPKRRAIPRARRRATFRPPALEERVARRIEELSAARRHHDVAPARAVVHGAEDGEEPRPREGELDVNIVPLFETIVDLRNCSRVMDELLGLPEYQRLLERRRK